MSRQLSVSVDNTFVKGLITEATGLNFPPNAFIDSDNVIPSILGNISRRPGIDLEVNFGYQSDLNRDGLAVTSFLWKNAGGDGITQLYVIQIGNVLTFYKSSSATPSTPLSLTRLSSTSVNLNNFIAIGSIKDPGRIECQYAAGNGYLFIFHPNCDPIYCSLDSSGTIVTGTRIPVKIRDFLGVLDNIPVNVRPNVLGQLHPYNLQNQGWTSGNSWGTSCSASVPATIGSHIFSGVTAGLTIVIGSQAAIADASTYAVGTVTAYAGTDLTINITSTNNPGAFFGSGIPSPIYSIASLNTSLIDNFFTAMGIYPSNADVWWTFKNTLGVFSPATTVSNVTLGLGNAPQGHFVLDAFNQQRSALSNIAGLSPLVTTLRPRTGAWFQGRVWYAGVDASQTAATSNPFYTWTESIYFSEIVTSSQDFGLCYQSNDPTSEQFADLLPSDGGVIQIQDCGSIQKLFPVQNGILVFASNGIWFITGSTGIGFTANDYTSTKISGVQTLTGTSFVNVLGWPVFWNEEGIYSVTPNQQGSLEVNNMCLGTILSYYSGIPTLSKKFARGDYNPLTYIISWIFRSTDESSSDASTRYEYDKILNYNTATKAFYVDTIGNISNQIYVNDIKYVPGLGSPLAESTFKFLTSANRFQFTFAEANDTTNWKDFSSYNGGVNYTSHFVTGYKLKGNALRRWEPIYTYLFTNNNPTSAYKLQGIWDYATSGNSGRYSSQQTFFNDDPYASISFRKHKIRGHGLSLQIRIDSVDGQPFDIIGWSMMESSNASV